MDLCQAGFGRVEALRNPARLIVGRPDIEGIIMRLKLLLLAIAVSGAATLGAGVTANAQSGRANNYCAHHPKDRDCVAHRRRSPTVGSVLKKTGNVIVGAGRVVGSAVEAGYCDARYKSYDRRTNTYRGRDGRRHHC